MTAINQIIQGYCPDALKEIDTDIVNLTVTSPPYDDLRGYNSSYDFEATARELYRITKPGGVLVWVVADQTRKSSESFTSLKQALFFKEQAGFHAYDTMIYAKNNPTPMNHRRYEQTWEYMFVFSKGKPTTFNPIMVPLASPRKPSKDVHHEKNYARGNSQRGHKTEKIKGNIWSYNIGLYHCTDDLYAHEHPAIFPEALVADHINTWTVPGDTVFDPFTGSGTTLKVAKTLQRSFLGVECETKYIEIAEKRLSGTTGETFFVSPLVGPPEADILSSSSHPCSPALLPPHTET
jgi:site-specific DNA-methyltransferase (adenine-specific)